MQQKLGLFFYLFILSLTLSAFSPKKTTNIKLSSDAIYKEKESIYNELGLSELGLSKSVFNKAINGWHRLMLGNQLSNTTILTIADLSQSSNHKRLYIIDLMSKSVIFNTYVAHGKKSGEEYACAFSNKLNSYKSSLGFYVTSNTYQGSHGLSLRLKGNEHGINDKAETRGIVMHGADYVSEAFIHQCGRLGRSEGCPAIPTELSAPIISLIKEGSCLFVYSNEKKYFRRTSLL
jgi:hypothetical protein